MSKVGLKLMNARRLADRTSRSVAIKAADARSFKGALVKASDAVDEALDEALSRGDGRVRLSQDDLVELRDLLDVLASKVLP